MTLDDKPMRIPAYRYRGERRGSTLKIPCGASSQTQLLLAHSFTDFLIVSQLETFVWSSVFEVRPKGIFRGKLGP